ncbi:MAG TPA: type II secretion system protein GspD, partial [Verrucomicrobiae bacterium]|nr:type II secretion system protein GspD [Verrucomicrobiae bacterium]
AEVSVDRLQEVGVQLGALGGGTSSHLAAAGIFDPFNFAGAATAQQQAVVRVVSQFSDLSNITAVLNALNSRGGLNVLSTPTILTSDNKEAEIFVGENVPFLGKVDLSNSGVSQQSIERKDTGITLRITPQISEGEYIKLDIYQEISAVKDSVGQAKDLVTTKRSAKTSVVVRDKDTVAIGGLIQNREREVVNKVWLLGDIPILGWLFKNRSTRNEKTNLLILLTPRIIRGAEDAAAVAAGQRTIFGVAGSEESAPTIEQALERAR